MALEEIIGNMEVALKRLWEESMSLLNLDPQEIEAHEDKIKIKSAVVGTLAELVSENTVSSINPAQNKSTVPLVGKIEKAFRNIGVQDKDISVHTDYDDAGQRQAGIVIRIAPDSFDAETDAGGIALLGHLDVVEEGDSAKWVIDGKVEDPFKLLKGVSADGEEVLYGRGASDMKGGVANILAVGAMMAAHRNRLEKPLYLCFNWGEETWDKGIESVTKGLDKLNAKPDVVLDAEPTGENIVVTEHNGYIDKLYNLTSPPQEDDKVSSEFVDFRKINVVFSGISCHSSNPYKGVDATRHFLEFACNDLKDLIRRDWKEADIRITNINTLNEGTRISEKVSFDIEIASRDAAIREKILGDIGVLIEAANDKIMNEAKAKTTEEQRKSSPPSVMIYSTDQERAGFSSSANKAFFDEIAPNMLKIYREMGAVRREDDSADRFWQEGFDPEHATMNLHSLRSGQDGSINFGVSYRCNRQRISEEFETELCLVEEASKRAGCLCRIDNLSDLPWLGDQDAAKEEHLGKIKAAITRSRKDPKAAGEVKGGTEPGYADTGHMRKWADAKGLVNCLMCQWHPFDVDGDWNNIHGSPEYTRLNKELYPGFKGILEIARDFTGLGLGKGLGPAAEKSADEPAK